MADDRDNSEKTEEPTAQRREEFREQGQVAQSRELSTVFMLFGVALVMWFLGKFFLQQVIEMFTKTYQDYLVVSARSSDYSEVVKFCLMRGLYIISPILLTTGVLGLASTLFQVGFVISPEVVSPNLDKVDPIQGFQRIFSLRSVIEGLKAILKVILVTGVVYMVIKHELETSPYLINFSMPQLLVYFGTISLKIIFWVAVFMGVLAVFDYGYQKWDLEQKMRMTKQEVKDEIKTREGDPQIKARIRRIQRDLSSKRMMASVPKADVIITNPTHIAVAIMYTAELPAPQVVAKGAGVIAEKIRELAREHKIPIVENKPLARTLFKTIKIGQIVPRELYNAVAEVLAYVYRIKKKFKKQDKN